jgi:predicted membrane channel-forming protein YqfA (hemolysin III family)
MCKYAALPRSPSTYFHWGSKLDHVASSAAIAANVIDFEADTLPSKYAFSTINRVPLAGGLLGESFDKEDLN